MARASRRKRQSRGRAGPVSPDGVQGSATPATSSESRPATQHNRAPSPAARRRKAVTEAVPLVSFRVALFAALLGALVIAVPAVLYRLGDLPIVHWDESQVATDALEMARSGFTIAPTNGGVIDHFLLKPPLAIWLESLAIITLGANEIAIRLPSVVAALGTAGILFGWFAIYFRRPAAAFIAIAVLFSSAGYLDFHAARSGDVDSLMAFLTLGWLVAAFLYLEDHPKRRRLWLTLAAVALALDFMVKSGAALIPLPAVILYALWRGRLREVMRTRAVWVAAASVIAVIVAYFGIRETVDPGYTALAIGHDLFDRSAATLEGHAGPLSFYVDHSINGTIGFLKPTGAFPLLVPSIIATGLLAAFGNRRIRPIAGFIALALVVTLAELSAMTTKIVWYALPLYPLAAAGVGVTVSAVLDWAVRSWPGGRRVIDGGLAAAALVIVAIVVPINAGSVDARVLQYRADEQYATGLFLAGPVARSGQSGYVIAVDPGFMPVSFYARAIAMDNHPATLVSPTDPLPPGTTKVVSCGQATMQEAAQGYVLVPLLTSGSCALSLVAAPAGAATP